MKKTLTALLFAGMLSPIAQAADYDIDVNGAHAFINFKTSHLGYSWLTGRFNQFDGTFTYDEDKPDASSVKVTIKTASIDSNHAERDKHLRSDDFLNVEAYPEATFVSTKITDKGEGNIEVKGNFTLHGTTNEITIDAEKIGEGKDPWGGYRAGFAGETTIRLADYGMKEILGPTTVELELHIEGVRK
ncbi:MAG: YceI family protein [Pseudomonadota bacterium]